MRLFLGIILLLFCLFIGYCLTGKYYLRRVFFADFYNFNTMLAQETAFAQKTLADIIKSKNKKTDFYLLLSNEFLGEAIENKITYLSKQEKNYVYEYLEKIGKVDKNTQLEYLKNINDYIKQKHENCILDENKYKALYIKLAFLIGLIMLIVVL